MKDNIHFLWSFTILGAIALIFAGLIIITETPYNINLSMDDNTLEAFNKALEYQNEDSNNYLINLSDFNHNNIGHFCKTKEYDDYTLSVWWDGGGSTRGLMSFTCGFSNKEGAVKYKDYNIIELNKWMEKVKNDR